MPAGQCGLPRFGANDWPLLQRHAAPVVVSPRLDHDPRRRVRVGRREGESQSSQARRHVRQKLVAGDPRGRLLHREAATSWQVRGEGAPIFRDRARGAGAVCTLRQLGGRERCASCRRRGFRYRETSGKGEAVIAQLEADGRLRVRTPPARAAWSHPHDGQDKDLSWVARQALPAGLRPGLLTTRLLGS
jgi:hypothetical protein